MKANVLEIRPTQLALGMKEVQYRTEKMKKMSAGKLKDYIKEHAVPFVMGPNQKIFCIDRHHFVRSCWEADVQEVHLELKADFSHLDLDAMWTAMSKAGWVYPYDQFGVGPHPTTHLPEDVRGMADDPYRSLAWMVREKGGFEKSTIPFTEFKWANFFRNKMRKHHPVLDGFDLALKEAMTLAKQGKSLVKV